MNGVMPNTISAIFAVSPRPSAMNRIGSTAIGGMTAIIAIIGPKVARAAGNRPSSSPTSSVVAVAIARPIQSRERLAHVSAQAGICPVVGSVVAHMRTIASPIWMIVGSTLSEGFSKCRASEASI